jgi:hypothetical protein
MDEMSTASDGASSAALRAQVRKVIEYEMGFFTPTGKQAARCILHKLDEKVFNVLRGFRVGDRVKHFDDVLGLVGEVVSLDNDAVKVRFVTKGHEWFGAYDDLWFRLHPEGLTIITDEPRGLSAAEGASPAGVIIPDQEN